MSLHEKTNTSYRLIDLQFRQKAHSSCQNYPDLLTIGCRQSNIKSIALLTRIAYLRVLGEKNDRDQSFCHCDKDYYYQYMKSNKYSLLNKTENDEKYQIGEREQFELTSVRQNISEDTPYQQLREVPNEFGRNEKPNTSMWGGKPEQKIESGQVMRSNYPAMQPPPQHPIHHSQMMNSKVTLNPTNSKINQEHHPLPPSTIYKIPKLNNSVVHVSHSGVQIQPRAPFVPPVVAVCSNCECKQHIPGDASQFYCCRCNRLNDINPKFGLFICGICRQHVSYPFNTSDMIQCNICYSVNRVPLTTQNKAKQSKFVDKEQCEMILLKQLRQDQGEVIEDDVTTMKSETEYTRARRNFQKQ